MQVPEPLIPPAGARIMSLTDGFSKVINVVCQTFRSSKFVFEVSMAVVMLGTLMLNTMLLVFCFSSQYHPRVMGMLYALDPHIDSESVVQIVQDDFGHKIKYL